MEIVKLEGGTELVDFTPQNAIEAEELRLFIYRTIENIQSNEQSLAANFIQLGATLYKIREEKYWMLWKFHSFNEYIGSLGEKINKGRTQIYYLIGIAERLLPVISEQKLLTMGVTKATQLAKYVKDVGGDLPDTLVNKALDPAVSTHEIQAEVFKLTNALPDEKGKYFSLGGFFVTDEEKEELDRIMDIAAKTDPPLNNMPEWAVRKESFFRLGREYLATYESAVLKGQA